MRGYEVPCLLALALALPAPAAPAAAASAQDGAKQERKEERKPRKKARAATEQVFGREGDPRKVKRVIRIDMSDAMRFFPDQVRVKRGDTVRFEVRNSGRLAHEMVIGTLDDLKQRARLMRENGDTETGEAHVTRPAPGETGRIVWQFTRAGEFYFACLVPGHFDAGMMGTIVVR